jgi:hypothetical protein
VSGYHVSSGLGNGANDIWIVKLKPNTNGEIQWQKCYGGSGGDAPSAIQETKDGGYIVFGSTYSNDGDVSGKHGFGTVNDMWLFKLSPSSGTVPPTIEWQKCFGGATSNGQGTVPRSFQETKDGGYLVVGSGSALSGDLWLCYKNHDIFFSTFSIQDGDVWVMKLSPIVGTIPPAIEWQKYFGGSSNERAVSILPTADGSYIVAGYTDSNDGNVSGNHGDRDFWLVKMGVPPTP